MIPLNKPGVCSQFKRNDVISNALMQQKYWFFFTAGDALNKVYNQLYKEHGSLKIAVSPLACYQAIYPIVLNNHIPIFIDIDKFTFNIDLKNDNINDADAIEIIHLGGVPAEMSDIKANNKILIEDCAQAMGALWNNQLLGTFGNFGVYSLLKNIYSPAGMLVAKDEIDNSYTSNVPLGMNIYKKFKHHLESKASYKKSINNGLYWLLMNISRNKRDTINHIRQVEDVHIFDKIYYLQNMNEKRRVNAEKIKNNIKSNEIIWQSCGNNSYATYNRLLFLVPYRKSTDIISLLRKHGIAANNLLQSYVKPWQEHISKNNLLSEFYVENNLPNYNDVFNHLVAIPNSPFLTDEEILYITRTLNYILK